MTHLNKKVIQKWYPCLRNLDGRLLPLGPMGLEKFLARGISPAPLLGWKQKVRMCYIRDIWTHLCLRVISS